MITTIDGISIANAEKLNVQRAISNGRFYAFVEREIIVPDGPHLIIDLLIASSHPVTKAPLWDRMFAHKEAILKSRARITVVMTGVEGGKSINGPMWMYDKIVETDRPGLTWLVTGPTLVGLKRQVIPYYQDFFDQTPLRGWWKESDNKYVLNDGKKGELLFLYAETDGEAGAIREAQGYAVHADEMGLQTEEVGKAIMGRVAGHGGPMFVTTTAYLRRPYLKQQLYDPGTVYFWEREQQDYILVKSGDPEIAVFRFECEANPYYSREALDFARRNLDDRSFDIIYGGAVPRIAGVVYPEFSVEGHVAT